MNRQGAAQERATFPPEAANILRARTLAADHPHLAGQLRPGQRVLDVGCGTGALTAGMAGAVGAGQVIGLDPNVDLLEEARQAHGGHPNLSFVSGDVYRLEERDDLRASFDVVVAARVLQWLDRPGEAVRQMAGMLRPGGHLFLLDYNHLRAALTPPPPPSMLHFRERYLAWRAEAGMHNEVADHLEGFLREAGLDDIGVVEAHERTRRGDPDFGRRIRLWGDVARTRGHQVVAAGLVTEAERQAAVGDFTVWTEQEAQEQTLYLLSVVGTKPG